MNQAINHRQYVIYYTYQMTWVPFKNNVIWQSYGTNKAHMPIFGHMFLAIFWPIGLKMFMGTQETIIYRWVKRNPSYHDYFQILIFWAGRWAWSSHRPIRVWGLKTQPKRWPTGRTFWVNCYLENMFLKFSGLNPPAPYPLNKNHKKSYINCTWLLEIENELTKTEIENVRGISTFSLIKIKLF